MGYIRHHAIIVTGTYEDHAERAHQTAVQLATKHLFADLPHVYAVVTPLSAPAVNHTRSFAVLPDGSKEGWEESDHGDAFRTEFVQWLRAQAYEDGSSPLAWVEVQYGDGDGETVVLAHSDEDHHTQGAQR